MRVKTLPEALVSLKTKEWNVGKDKRTSVYFDRETLQFVGVDEAVKKQLSDTYKGVDVNAELGKMALWLSSSKGNKRRGNVAFIMNWLNNAVSDRGSHKTSSVEHPCDLLDDSLRPIFQEYLQDLWKNREHILEINTRKS